MSSDDVAISKIDPVGFGVSLGLVDSCCHLLLIRRHHIPSPCCQFSLSVVLGGSVFNYFFDACVQLKVWWSLNSICSNCDRAAFAFGICFGRVCTKRPAIYACRHTPLVPSLVPGVEWESCEWVGDFLFTCESIVTHLVQWAPAFRASRLVRGNVSYHSPLQKSNIQCKYIPFVRPNPPPLSVLVRVMVLRITCVAPKFVVTWNVTSISINFQLILSHDVLLMLASWTGRALAFSKVQPAALATQALKDIPLETLALANALSSVLFTSVGPWVADCMIQLRF